jgi:hypothetical protein
MEDFIVRFTTDLIGRLTGPLAFRLILQPGMAMFFACRDGLAHGRVGHPTCGACSPDHLRRDTVACARR